MVDLVGTCPKDFWEEWIAEGDTAGDPYTGEEWGWWTKHSNACLIHPGDRFYVVAHGMLRGWAPVTRVVREGPYWVICRRGNAVACTLDAPIKGFRGLQTRWWDRCDERAFPDWKTRGVPPRRIQAGAAMTPPPAPDTMAQELQSIAKAEDVK